MESTFQSDRNLQQSLNWLSDETFFSLCSRIHFFNGLYKHSDTTLKLFGAKNGGALHDFPTCIDAFIVRSNNDYGDAKSIVFHHTIAPFFAPFQTRENSQFLLKAMQGNGLGMV